MSLRIALALLPLLLATPHALSASPSKIEHLAWLAGCWQLDGQPPGAGEQWTSLAGTPCSAAAAACVKGEPSASSSCNCANTMMGAWC